MNRIIIKISEQENNTRIDRLIKRYYPVLTQGIIEKSLRKGLITLDNKKVSSNHRVISNQSLSIFENITTSPPHENITKVIIPEQFIDDFRKSILFYNKDIIIINKQSGLATQGGSKIKFSVDDLVKRAPEFKNYNPKLVHRIDKETSGILVLAANVHSANMLTKFFREKLIQKKYLALVLGKPKENKGIIDIPISKNNEHNFEKVRAGSSGDKAITEYRLIDHISDKLSLIEFRPITGRTHQIRVHAKLMNMPIVGDSKYGFIDSELDLNQNKLCLHSWKVKIENLFGENYEFTAPISKHMRQNMHEFGLEIK